MGMSYQEAVQQAITLRNQGLTYPAIANHFKQMGYKSPFSRKEIGHLAVRTMIKKFEAEEQKAKRADAAMIVAAPKQDVLDAVEKLIKTDLALETKLYLVRTLLEKTA